MQPKIARRFLNRNGHKLAVHRINETGNAMLKRARIARKVLKKGLMDKLWKNDTKMKVLKFLKIVEENVMQEEREKGKREDNEQ